MEPRQNSDDDTTDNIRKISTIRLQRHKKISVMVIRVDHTRWLTCFFTACMAHSGYRW
jgi:hypothetical protein